MTALDTLTATIDHLLVELPADELSGLVATLEGGKARALARIVSEAAAPKADTTPRLVDAAGMAAMLGVPTFWVQDKARRGIIPSVSIGHYRRFTPPRCSKSCGTCPTHTMAHSAEQKNALKNNECPSVEGTEQA